MTSRTLLITVAAAGLLGGAGGAAIENQFDDGPQATRAAAPLATATRPVADHTAGATALTAGDIYDRSKDAAASIPSRSAQGVATGTGFAITQDGYIVTNAHVIDGASTVTVKVGDGHSTQAKVVGVDQSTDIALLKVDTGDVPLATLRLGDSSAVDVGDAVF